MALGISPTVDYAFKRLLGDPHHKRVLIHLLNAIFEKQFVVVDVDILNPFLEKDFEDDKLSVLDLRARDTCGRQYNLEMQTSVAGALTRRLVYYLACIYSQQLGESEKYDRLAPAMSICFLDGILFRESPAFHTRFQLCSLEHQLVFSDQLEVHLIELAKYRGEAAVLPRARPVEKQGKRALWVIWAGAVVLFLVNLSLSKSVVGTACMESSGCVRFSPMMSSRF
jgi:predicted transposase/invertase (TIGR01784 family)